MLPPTFRKLKTYHALKSRVQDLRPDTTSPGQFLVNGEFNGFKLARKLPRHKLEPIAGAVLNQAFSQIAPRESYARHICFSHLPLTISDEILKWERNQ